MKIMPVMIISLLLAGIFLAAKIAPEVEIQPAEIARIDTPNVAQEIVWNADLSKIAVSTGFEIQVWDARTWELLFTIPDAYVYAIGWHPEQNLLAGLRSGGYVQSILLWDGSTGQPVRTISRTLPSGGNWGSSSLEWSPDGKTIATEGVLSPVLLWDVETNATIPFGSSDLTEDSYDITELAWSKNGDYLASAGYPTIHVWDVVTGKNVLAVTGYKFVTWHPDSVHFAGAGFENAVNIWNVETGAMVFQFLRHADTITGVDWHPDGSTITSTDADNNLFVWDAWIGKILFSRTAEHFIDVEWKPDGSQLAVIDFDAVYIYSWKSPA